MAKNPSLTEMVLKFKKKKRKRKLILKLAAEMVFSYKKKKVLRHISGEMK